MNMKALMVIAGFVVLMLAACVVGLKISDDMPDARPVCKHVAGWDEYNSKSDAVFAEFMEWHGMHGGDRIETRKAFYAGFALAESIAFDLDRNR